MPARHEYKHSINYADYVVLRDRLRRLLPRDAHAGGHGIYKVHTLYFDTPTDRALRAKIDGVDKRDKYRIRRYTGGDGLISLEKKSKAHGLTYKNSVALTNEETSAILAGDIAWMSADSRDLILETYSKIRSDCLVPKSVVIYEREPFVYPAGNVRITFDSNIRAGVSCMDFLEPDQSTIKVGDEMVILEVKYDQFIPDFIAETLQLGNRQVFSFSKYAASRQYD